MRVGKNKLLLTSSFFQFFIGIFVIAFLILNFDKNNSTVFVITFFLFGVHYVTSGWDSLKQERSSLIVLQYNFLALFFVFILVGILSFSSSNGVFFISLILTIFSIVLFFWIRKFLNESEIESEKGAVETHT